MQETASELKQHRSGPAALTAFALVAQGLAWALYIAALPDFMIVHHIDLSGLAYSAWAGAAILLATALIAASEHLFKRRLLPHVAFILFAVWAVIMLEVVFNTPMVMMQHVPGDAS